MKTLLPIVLVACGTVADSEVVFDADATELSDALEAADPGPFVDLVDDPQDYAGVVGNDCTLIEVSPGREQWNGPCTTADGAVVEGRLELVEGSDGGTWLAGEAFSVSRGGVVELYLDGAIELEEQGDLLRVDAAASWCGTPGPDCSEGPLAVDLEFTVFPLAGYPSRYDATVSGAVGLDDALISVEGAWSVDEATCASEPASGVFAVRGADRHTVEMDGANDCDACAAWTVHGIEVPAYCFGE